MTEIVDGEPQGGGASKFTELDDTPADYTGEAGSVVSVAAGEDALEFTALAGGGNVSADANMTDHTIVRGDGGAKKVQDTGITVDDSDNMAMNSGNISSVGTVDGRDVSVDGSKTDGIEALADVTDSTNVAAAGAVMDADFGAADEIMVGTGVGTHGQVTLAASQFLAKKAAGAATNVTAAEAMAILSAAAGANFNFPNNIAITLGDAGENIVGDGTDLTITSSNLLNLSAATDIIIPVNVGLKFGDGGEHIEGDNTNLTITSAGAVSLSGATVVATQGITDNHVLTVDGTPNDDEFARFTAAGIEGLTTAEAMAALSGGATAAFSFNEQALTNVGNIGCDEITLVDGYSINLQEAITFTGATTENKIEMPDALAVALDITEAGNSYMLFKTTDGDESVVFGKKIELGENSLELDEALSADGTWSGIVVDGLSGYTSTAFGGLVYLDSTSHRWEQADANAAATAGPVMLGIALTVAADGAAVKILTYGFVREDDWTFTPETVLYVGLTAGAMTHTAPSAAPDIVRVVGYCHDNAGTIFFNPSGSWVEIV